MDTDKLPESEAALLTILLKLPYHKRTSYALRLVHAHRNNPALLSVIQGLLSITLLTDQVPFPGAQKEAGFLTLLCPQSTASKRFFQRELGLAMASALGRPGVPFLLDAIVHPSTAGKSRAIKACVSPSSGAADSELVETYHKSVPATQRRLHAAMVTAGRVEVLKTLQLWRERDPPMENPDPKCVMLEKELKNANPRDRDAIWTRSGLSLCRPHHHLHDPKYVQKEDNGDLVSTILNLIELYPPPHLVSSPFKLSQEVPSIPSSLDRRIYSFLVYDLPRTLRLVRNTCFIPDPEHNGRDLLKLPSSFMHHPSTSRFWHMLSLERQKKHLLPFILELMQTRNQVLLKNGQLRSADLLRHARWQIVVAVVNSALASLESTQAVDAMSMLERNGIVDFVVHTIGMLSSRLRSIAYREDLFPSQMAMEHGLADVLRHSVGCVLATCRVSAPSDGIFMEDFTAHYLLPLLEGPLKQYPPLVEVLFESVKGLFDITQASKPELVLTACQFLRALKEKELSVFDIPGNGVVQPYCGIKGTANDAVFNLLLRFENPRDNPFLYVSAVLDELLEEQQEVIWTYFNDPEYIRSQIFDDDGGQRNVDVFVKILTALPSSPRSRLPIVRFILDQRKIEYHIAAAFYPLLDISDLPSRELLQKKTYTRVSWSRHRTYEDLMVSTYRSREPKHYIATMNFLIPRIRNESLHHAQTIPEILQKCSACEMVYLWGEATDDEAKEMAGLYLALERQNNEAVSRVIPISDYLLSLANLALTHFAGSPAHPFFHFGMTLLWVREVFHQGLLKAHETYSIRMSTTDLELTENEEIKRRKFLLASKDALGRTGYWRISDERRLADTLLEQYHEVHHTLPFELSAAYPAFITHMHELLGVRWTTIPALREYTERQLDVLRSIAGSKENIADWRGKAQQEAIQHIVNLRAIYHDDKVTPEVLPWWSEFRRMRLFSTEAALEVDLLYRETFGNKGKQSRELLNKLVEELLGIDDSAVHLEFVRLHLMESRQDLIKDSHITDTCAGLFHQLSDNAVALRPPWEFTFPRRLYPHQCELFAAMLMETIYSGEVPLGLQVKAAQHLTKLPTTTVVELANVLKEDLNQRVIEAILMFLPHLDEPASGIQLLLAPTYLDCDLARTVVSSIRKPLQHVPISKLPKILIPVFPPENSKRLLKITVMKELVRVVCQPAHEDLYTFLLMLWRRKLHQDVRTVFLQSVVSLLGSEQENLAWTILQDAVSNHELVLDDALFALVAVRPQPKPSVDTPDIKAFRTCFNESETLTDMATNTIPTQCHDMYTENVLYPLSQMSVVVAKLSLNEEEGKLIRERLCLLQKYAYRAIFSRFLTASNAGVFAQRGFQAAQNMAFCNVQVSHDLFPFLVDGIDKCVRLDPRCWEVLCQLVSFLASAVGSPGREPTGTSLKAVERLHQMNLGSNMTFLGSEPFAKQLTMDRMSLLEPLISLGCDHFAITFWERRFHLFSYERERVFPEKRDVIRSLELDEARSLLLELTRLAGKLQCDIIELKDKTISLIDTVSAPVADTLVEDLLSGSHGFDFIGINELRLEVLTRRVQRTTEYARSLATFQTLVSSYHNSFYARNWEGIKSLVLSILTMESRQKPAPQGCVAILLDPLFDRAESSVLDSDMLHHLLDALPDVILRHRPQWGLEEIDKILFSLRACDANTINCRAAIKLVEFVNTTSLQGNFTANMATEASAFSPLAALLVEVMSSGTLRNFDLERVISGSAQKMELVLYPYFVISQDDGSGDMEDRQSMATVPQLRDRYQNWKSTYALQYLSDGAYQPRMPPAIPAILHEVFGRFPQLALVHTSHFLSHAKFTFSQSDLNTKAKIDYVLSHLQTALLPQRHGEYGTRWGWAPPLSLTLSFARTLLTETANDVAEATLDGYVDVGPTTCKLAALQLLQWWVDTFYGADIRDLQQLVKAMEQGEGRADLMRKYDELRLLACRDESAVVREKAFMMRAGDLLKIGSVGRRLLGRGHVRGHTGMRSMQGKYVGRSGNEVVYY